MYFLSNFVLMVNNEKVMRHAGDALAAFSPQAELYK